MKTFFNKALKFVRETNLTLLFMCLGLSLFGTIMVHSATLYTLTEDAFVSRGVITMVVSLGVGVIGGLILSAFGHDVISRLWAPIGFASFGLMLSLFIFGTSPEGRDDAISWINLGFFYFQPSELLKFAFSVTFAVHLDTVKDDINKFKNIVYLALHGFLAVAIVILTGDLGSALVFMVMFIGLMFIAGVKLRYFAMAIAAVGVLAPIIWFEFLADFQKQRFLAVYSPESLSEAAYENNIFQQKQGLSAIGSGQLWGTGLFKGEYTQNNLVPVSDSDMIFTVVGEELGFVGCIALLLAILLVVLKIISIGKKSINTTGKYMCYAVALMIAAQTIINVGVCLKVLPVIGITLPFISAGGSANMCIYFSIGLVLSVYRSSVDRGPAEARQNTISTPFEEV